MSGKKGNNLKSGKGENFYSVLGEEPPDLISVDLEATTTIDQQDSGKVLDSLQSTLSVLQGQLNDLRSFNAILRTDVAESKIELSSLKSKYNHLLEEHYNFKKDVRTLLGLESPPSNVQKDPLSTQSGMDINFSFRAVIEQISNPLDPLLNHNFQHFMVQYAKWKNYKGRGGFLSLYGYVQKSPAVFNVFLHTAKSTDPSFDFHILHDDEAFFTQLIDKVFFPSGFDITAFRSLIKSKKMTTFSISNVAQYAFDISSIISLLFEQLDELLTPDLWHVTCAFTQPHGFQKFLSRRCPSNRKQFLSTLDSSARLYDQQYLIQQSEFSDNTNGNRRQFQEFRQSDDTQGYRRQDSPNRLKQINFVGKGEHVATTATCSKCFKRGHFASKCLLDFCSSCHTKEKEFMHSDHHCPAAQQYSEHQESDSDLELDF